MEAKMLRRSSPQTCPGINRFVRPTPEFIKCPFCGAEVEIWSDEESAVCQNCGKTVKRNQQEASCLEYCLYAEKCKELIASMKKSDQQK